MDQQRFDRLARLLGQSTSRRAGVLGAFGTVAGLAAASSAEASRKATRRHEKLACRNANSQCISDDDCCSNRCVPKFGGTEFRCAKRHAKKKHGGNGGANPPAPLNCTVCADGCPYATIEEAVVAEPAGSVITIAPGTYNPPSTKSGAFIEVNHELSLVACDPQDRPIIETVTNRGDHSVIYVHNPNYEADPFDVLIDGIIFRDGTDVAAISTTFALDFTMRNCTVEGFQMLNLPVAYFQNIGSVLVDDCTFTDNVSEYPETAVIRHYTITPTIMEIRNSSITNNTSNGLNGGAVVGSVDSSLTLTGNTVVRGNTSTNQSDCAGLYISNGVLTLDASVDVSENTSAGVGAGVCINTGGSLVGGNASTVHDNHGSSCPNIYNLATTTCVLA